MGVGESHSDDFGKGAADDTTGFVDTTSGDEATRKS